jgi:tetratricopeptide (TPR) repeat protein
MVLLTLLFTVLAVAVWGAARHTPWYQEWRYSRLPLPALERERHRGWGDDDPRLLYHLGRRLNEQQRFAEADPVLRRAVGLDPDTARLRGEWARALLGSGLVTAAFGQLHQFAGTHPDSAPAHLLLGKFYFAQRSLRRAAQELERAAALDPASPEVWSLLANTYRDLNDLPGAERAAARAVSLRPNDAGARLLWAKVLARSGRAAPARREYERALALGPGHPQIRRDFAQWLLDSGDGGADVSRAEAEAARAVARDPRDAQAHLILGRSRLQKGTAAAAEGAAAPLIRAAELAPDDPAPVLALVQVYRKLGRTADARRWEQDYLRRQRGATRYTQLFDAVRANPEAPEPRRRFARFLAGRGDAVGCIRQHAAALRCAFDAPPALIAAANDLADAGHAAEALPLAERAAKIGRANPAAFEALGNALLGLGRAHEAALQYDKAIVVRPQRYAALKARLERFWAERERNPTPADRAYRTAVRMERTQVGPRTLTPEVEAMARQAVDLEPTNLDYLRYLLRVQVGLRKTDAAVDTANRLLERFPGDAEAHAWLGMFLADRAAGADEMAAAEEHLKQAKAASSPSTAATRHYGLGSSPSSARRPIWPVRELRESLRLDPKPT